jgi:hypothetical protein
MRHKVSHLPRGFLRVHALCLVSLLSCRRTPPAPPTHPLATLDGQVIVTVEDLQGALRQSPSSPSRTTDRAGVRALLDGLIGFELLSREAAKAGLASDDEVQRQKKKAMVNRFVEQKLNRDPRAHTASEEDLRAFYEKHKSDYLTPERFHVRLIELTSADGGARADPDGGGEGQWGGPDGHLARWMTHDELVQACGEAGATAIEGLTMGQTSAPIRGPHGWCSARLLAKQPASNKSFEQVKSVIQGRADSALRAALADQYAEELDRRSHWQADDAALSTVDPMNLPEEGK